MSTPLLVGLVVAVIVALVIVAALAFGGAIEQGSAAASQPLAALAARLQDVTASLDVPPGGLPRAPPRGCRRRPSDRARRARGVHRRAHRGDRARAGRRLATGLPPSWSPPRRAGRARRRRPGGYWRRRLRGRLARRRARRSRRRARRCALGIIARIQAACGATGNGPARSPATTPALRDPAPAEPRRGADRASRRTGGRLTKAQVGGGPFGPPPTAATPRPGSRPASRAARAARPRSRGRGPTGRAVAVADLLERREQLGLRAGPEHRCGKRLGRSASMPRYFLRPVAAGISFPMITFSLSPSSRSTLPSMAASVRPSSSPGRTRPRGTTRSPARPS